MLLLTWPSTRWTFAVCRACCWCMLPIRDLPTKLFSSQPAPTSAATWGSSSCWSSTVAHVFVVIWEVPRSSYSSTSSILLCADLQQNQNQLFLTVKNVYFLACYRVLKAFGRNQLWIWYTNLAKSGFLIQASPEKQLMNGFISQQGFPRRRWDFFFSAF